MADDGLQASSHWSNFKGLIRARTSDPTNPNIGDMYYNTVNNALLYWTGNNWVAVLFT